MTTPETTTTTTPAPVLRLERETCSRCGGSGQHSYCQMYGTTCFKCAGRKEVLTKRGAAAAEYLVKLRSRRAADLKVGDTVYESGSMFVKAGWTKVTEIRPGEASRDGGSVLPDGTVKPAELVVTTGRCSHHVSADSLFRVWISKEHEAETLKQALAYQETLTKLGKSRKGQR